MNRYHFDKEQHLHYLDGRPLTGTSSVIKVLSKPLTWWASGKAVECFGWSNSKGKDGKKVPDEQRLTLLTPMLEEIKEMSPAEFLKLLDKAYRNHKDSLDKSADKGIDLHSELERFVRDQMSGHDGSPYEERITPFITWARDNVRRFLWSEAHCYNERLWTGGISDTGAILKDNKAAVIDFKSAKDAYPGAFIQDAGYALEIEDSGLLDAEGNSLKENIKGIKFEHLIVVPFGAEKVEPKFNTASIQDFKQGFEDAVGLYRLLGMEKEK